MTFREFLGGRSATQSLLKEFLESNGEWTKVEFKAARETIDFGLREAVCAQANSEGGDVFLGVNDGGGLDGTNADPEVIAALLRKKLGRVSQWYETDLIRYVPNSILPISLGDVHSKVLCIEVAANGVPCLVENAERRLEMYERRLRSSELMDAGRVIERTKEMGRAEMLREIYLEARRVIAEVKMLNQDLSPPDPMLPRLERILTDGTWERHALKRAGQIDDGNLLHPNSLGAIRAYPRYWRQMREGYAENLRDPRYWNALNNRQSEFPQAVEAVAQHMRVTHIRVPD